MATRRDQRAEWEKYLIVCRLADINDPPATDDDEDHAAADSSHHYASTFTGNAMDGLIPNCPKKHTLPGGIFAKAGSCKTSTAYLLLVFTAFLCTFQPMIRQALPASHDIAFHLFQADQFAGALASGTAIPHWVAASNNGHGSPNFIFYAPLSYYVTAIFDLVAGSVPASMIATIWLSFFLSGIGMFHAASRIAGREGALIAAFCYQILPYHLLDLYTRGTFAELFAFPWFPLIFLCAHGIYTAGGRKGHFVIGLSLAYASLILTHLVSGYIFTFVLFAYLAFNYLLYKSAKDLRLALFAMFAGLGLSSFYLLPAAIERKFVHIDFIVKCHVGDYRQNFLFLPQGYKEDLHDFYFLLHSMTILNFVLFLSLVIALVRFRKKGRAMSQHHFFMALFLSAFFLTTPLSGPLWATIPGFATLQFPWRWISMMELSSSMLIAALLSAGKEHPAAPATAATRAVCYCLTAITAVSLLIVAKSNLGHETRAGIYVVAREYTPASVVDLKKLLVQKQERVATVAGAASSEIRKWESERRVVEVRATTTALIRIGTSYYPGWKARLDGGKVGIDVEKQSGDMLIRVPEGAHILTLDFLDTPLRLMSKAISLATLMTLLLYGVLDRYRSPLRSKAVAPEGAGG